MAAEVQLLEGGILSIQLNRPEMRNALNRELMTTINTGLGSHLRSKEVKVVALHGAGGYFSAGADLNEMAAAREAGDEGKRQLRQAMSELVYLITELHTLNIPTVALIEGGASGGGVGLLSACQYVVATAGSKFKLPETGIGLFPFMISPPLIRRMGYENFLRLTFEGRSWTAEQAKEAGLVDEVAPHLPSFESLLALKARPGLPWPARKAGGFGAAASLVEAAPAHLQRAARVAAILNDSMSLPIAMRTAANELGGLVARLGEG